MQRWLIVGQDFGHVAFSVQDIAKGCILVGFIFRKLVRRVGFPSCCGTRHELIYIRTSCRDWQETNCCQDREAAAHTIWHHKGFPAIGIGFYLDRTANLIGGCINPFVGFLHTVFLNQGFLEDTKGNSWFCSCPRLGNDVDREILVGHVVQEVRQVSGRNRVSCIENLRCLALFLALQVDKGRIQEINSCLGTKIGTTNPDHHQNIAVCLNLFSRFLDAGKFFLIVIFWKVQPAQHLCTSSCTITQVSMYSCNLTLHIVQFMCLNILP